MDPASAPLSPVENDTEPDDPDKDDPDEIRTTPLSAIPDRLLKATDDPPTIDKDPPCFINCAWIEDPEEMDTDPPSPPSPADNKTDPPSCAELALDPADSAMLPVAWLADIPVETRIDPLWPDPAFPDPNTKSPLTLSESFERTTIDPLAPNELEPLLMIAEPPDID